MLLDMFTAFALFCDGDSQISTKHRCEQVITCVLKELEGPVGKSQIEVNQEIAIEKCTRQIMCKSKACSENVAR